MRTQRGFIGVGILIAIILGVVILGGGAYVVMHQNSAPQTSQNYPDISTQQQTQGQTTNTPVAQPTTNTPATTANSVAPTCTLTTPSNQVSVGQTFTLNWTSQNATAVSIMEQGTPGPAKVLLNGSSQLSLENPGTTNFTLTVTGKGGTKTCSVSVTATVTSDLMQLSLQANGLGVVNFGASPEQAISQLTNIVGAPSKDTGWINSFSTYGTCPGDKIRVVEWNRLRVFFGDTIFGTQKFFQFEYTGRDTTNQTPIIATNKGVTLGMSKSEVLARYPQAQILPWMENYEYMHLVPYNKDTHEYLGGTLQGGNVFWISGGLQCGE